MNRRLVVTIASLGLCACGGPSPGGGDAGPVEAGLFTVGGTVTGLAGTGLVLQNNGANDLTLTGNGPFVFSQAVTSGAAFAVTVETQPAAPWQTCAIAAGTGTVASGDVTSIVVTCSTNTYPLSGTVTGLAGTGLVLGNGASMVVVAPAADDGPVPFTLPAAPSGSMYDVTVVTAPQTPAQTCQVAGGDGTLQGAPVQNIAVTCTTNSYAVGGTVVGLTGTGLELTDNGSDKLAITGSGPFTFADQVVSGQGYSVTVLTQPASPAQLCMVAGATGTVGGATVTSVMVTCSTSYTIGGTLMGLSGSGLVLEDNGGDDLTINSGTTFAFATPLEAGAVYSVTIADQPTQPWQTCQLNNATGTVTGPVMDIGVVCATNAYSVTAQITGLVGGGLVLQDNGSDPLPVSTSDSPMFATPILSGGTYDVTVSAQPTNPIQICTVTGGTGTVLGAAVTVAVTCGTPEYTIGGVVSGLEGGGLQLLDNGVDPLMLNANGSYIFATPLPSGQPYSVAVLTQPPTQVCSVQNAAGSVAAADINDVNVDCQCGKGLADCDSNTANGCETTLGTNANCTFCGDTCNLQNANSQCQSTFCDLVSCNKGFANCDLIAADGCEVNTQTDANNCNSCGNTCPSGPASTPICTSGACGLNCNPGYLNCDGNLSDGCEINGNADQSNCGGCGKVCPTSNDTVACTGGACGIVACTTPFSDCNGQVADGCEVNTNTSAANCGACGFGCSEANGNAICNSGICGLGPCSQGHMNCDGQYASGCNVDTQTDVNNCGGCNQVCNLANATPTCSNGNCAIAQCNSSYSDCDGQAADGCEIERLSDPKNCGACGNECTLSNAVADCSNGACTIASCHAGHSHCSATETDGCETDTNTDSNNCGACGNKCTAPSACFNGLCAITISGTLSGLAANESVVLQDNGTSNLTLSANGPFTFGSALASGAAYTVTVLTNPTTPVVQTCVVTNGSGSGASANVTNVTVTCSANKYTVGGTLSGLAAGDVVLQDNGGDNLILYANGPFTFATAIVSGATYGVTVLTNPASPSQNCVVTSGGGPVTNATITSVVVTCTTDTCPPETTNHCVLTTTNSGTTDTGTCATGYTGACSYSCNLGVWTQVTDTCAASCAGEEANGNCILGATNSGSTDTGFCATGFTGSCAFACSNGTWTQVTDTCAHQCAGETIDNCVLSTMNSGGFSGTCAGIDTGSCTFSCLNGAWTLVGDSCTGF